MLINDAVVAAIRDLVRARAAAQPGQRATGSRSPARAFPDVPHVAVFDTAFHATLPPRAYTYAVPRAWGVRRYGFHGTSHAYVSREAARAARPRRRRRQRDRAAPRQRRVAPARSRAGASIDTSMGLTPLEGLVMGTRSGDVDPALVLHLRRTRDLSTDEIDAVLNSRSGCSRWRATTTCARSTAACARATPRPSSPSTSTATGSASTSAPTWPRSAAPTRSSSPRASARTTPVVRARSLAGLERLGIAVDPARNAAGETVISPDGAAVAVLVIPTDEELEMATQAAALVRAQQSATPCQRLASQRS